MGKNEIYLGGASKQNALFRKLALKNAPMPLMSRIDPAYGYILVRLPLTYAFSFFFSHLTFSLIFILT